MAKDRKKLQHIHSSIPDKQPTAASLEVAEIAVNNAADKEFLSIKNTNDKVVRFSSDGQIIEWIERKEVMPYVGYVRGAAGPSATSGDTPTADGYGSYGIENTDLLNNKSELVFKLNQVAADLTTKHDKVNGKKDMYNKDVNPTTDGGINDGAGFFIDMSRYAMQDANPQFSSTTNTCRTTLSGTTIIRGLDGSCGSLLDIKVNSATTEVNTATTKVTSAHTTVGTATTIVSGDTSLFVSGTTTEIKKGNVIENHSGTTTETKVGAVVENHSGTTTENFVGNFSGNTSGTTTEIKIGAVNEYHSGTTQETKKGDVTETNLANKVENTSGTSTSNIVVDNIVNVSGETHITTTGNTAIHTESKLGLTAKDDILESSESSITITANIDVCETAGGKASFYGVAQTNLGLDCADSTPSVVTNLYGETINTDADTVNTTVGTAITQVTSANTNINTATTVIGTASTKVNSAYTSANTATTIIKTANTSATTATLSGNTLTVNENQTTVNSCGKVEINTDNFSLSQCSSSGGSAEFEFCNGYTVKSNDVKIQHCDGATSSSISIKEKNIEISGGTITETSTGNTTINASGNTNINTKGDVALTTSGSTTINSTGSTTIQSTGNGSDVCITAADVAALKGTTKTNIGKDCSDGGQTTTLNLNGTTINETGTTVNVSGSTSTNISGGTVNVSGGTVNSSSANETCITAGTTAAFVGADKTNIGKNCSDGGQTTTLNINGTTINETGNTVNVSATTNVNISADTICESAKTEADFYAPKTQIGVSCNGSTATTVNISGTTINEGGTNLNQNVTNYDLNGAVICISGSTNSNFYGKETNIGVDCGGTTATTVNVSGTTINEGGTTNNNTFTTVNNTATTINNSTTNYNITGTSNVNVYGGDVCISGGTEASLGAKTVKIGTDCGTNTIATGITINATTSVTVNAPTTIITGDTYISGDTTIGDNLIVSGDTYLDGSLHLTTGLNKALNWVYDNVCNHATGTTVFAENSTDASRTITIPSSAAHIKRETLSWTYGSVTNATNGSYDPGSNTTTACTRNSDNSKFIIPKTVSDVTNGTVTLDTCLNVNTDICVTGKVSASNGFFQTSDRNVKENIEKPNYEKFVGARNTPIFKFNYKDDEEHRDIYGVIAQDAEANNLNEVVYTDENGKKAVDYTSLMILKIGYLEHDNAILRQQLAELYERVKKLEEKK